MTTTENPAIGQDVQANGIRTNYLESAPVTSTSCWCTVPGPG